MVVFVVPLNANAENARDQSSCARCASGAALCCRVALNSLLPCLRQAHANKRKGFDLSRRCWRWWSINRPVRYSTVSLSIVLAIVVLSTFVDTDSCRPAIVPDANHLEHIAALQLKLVASPWLIGPQDGDFVVRMDVVWRIIILEEG